MVTAAVLRRIRSPSTTNNTSPSLRPLSLLPLRFQVLRIFEFFCRHVDFDFSGEGFLNFFRYVGRDHRKRRAPVLLSITSYTAVARPSWRYDGPPRFKRPIHVVSLCVGGSHCLVYEVGDINSHWNRVEMLNYNPLCRLLEDRRIAVFGIGMKRFAEQTREEWGVHVANPVELRSVVREAIGEGKIRLGKLDHVEEMGEVVLDGLKMKEKSKRIKEMELGREEITEEVLMYATRDAYLAFEVGKKCFEMIGRKI